MSNYIEYKDTIAFHPGYYIKEIIDESGLTQEDFAKRLDTTPKNLSLLVRGEQNLSIDISMKLSRLIGTSVNYWLNLQKEYDARIAEFRSEQELEEERKIFDLIEYNYFRENFGLPDCVRKKDDRIRFIREYLNVSTLSVLKKRDMAVNFRSSTRDLDEKSTVCANILVQIATNLAMKTKAPKFNKNKFEEATQYALSLTGNHKDFYPLIRESFLKAGVVFIILPNICGSTINGATKRIGNSIVLMVNDRKRSAYSFWFTLFHEIGHIINGDYGISFEKEYGEMEEKADKYAEDSLIPPDEYKDFVKGKKFDVQSIKGFAGLIDRDAGIVLERLDKDGYTDSDDDTFRKLKHKYKVMIS